MTLQISKFSSFALIIIVALSMASCSEKTPVVVNTWRVDNVVINKPLPPQMQAYFQSQIEFMKTNTHTTYKADGTYEDVQGPRSLKGTWEMSKSGNIIYATDENGRTVRYLITELTKDKFTYKLMPGGPQDTLTFYMVPFSAKDTLNKKPMPQQMRPQQPRAEAPADSAKGGN